MREDHSEENQSDEIPHFYASQNNDPLEQFNITPI